MTRSKEQVAIDVAECKERLAGTHLHASEMDRFAEYEAGHGLPDSKMKTQLDRYYLIHKRDFGKDGAERFQRMLQKIPTEILEQDNPTDADLKKLGIELCGFIRGFVLYTSDRRSISYDQCKHEARETQEGLKRSIRKPKLLTPDKLQKK